MASTDRLVSIKADETFPTRVQAAINVLIAAGLVGKADTGHTHVAAQITDFTEAAQDAVAAMLSSGANVTLTYDDTGNSLQVTASGTDAEVVRDTIGAALVGINGLSVAVNDAADTITLSVSGLTIAQTTGLQTALDNLTTAVGTKVNTSTYTSGLAAKADALALTTSQTTDYTASVGQTVLADASGTSRTVVDGATTNASAIVTSVTAAFVAGDVGRPIFGLGIPLAATIASVQSGTQATMSANATQTATGVNVTIGSGQMTVTLPTGAAAGKEVQVTKADASPMPVLVVAGAGDTLTNGTTLRAQRESRRYIKDSGTTWRAVEGLTPFAANGAFVGGATTRQAGCIVSVTGDSIAPQRGTPPLQLGIPSGLASSWATWMHMYSGGKIQIGAVDGIGSTRGDQITARFPRLIEAAQAHFVVCDASYTNSSSVGVTTATFLAQLKTQCDMAAAAGATPVVHTGYPVPSAYHATVDNYRRAVMSAATRYGWILVDTWSLLMDPANAGNYLAAYDNGDNTHPNIAGKKLIGQAFATALQPYLTQFTPLPQMFNATADSGSLLSNGLFLTDTNSDGVPDGWTKSGAATVTTVTGDVAITGNAMRVTDAASAGFTQVVTGTLTGTATGRASHRIAFSGKVKVDNASAAVNVLCNLKSPTGGKTVGLGPVAAWSGTGSDTGGWRTFHLESIAPSDCNGIEVNINTNGGTSIDFRVAQLRVDDLG